MKLELKHLAPYLPYGLNCYCSGLVIDEYSDNPQLIKVEIVALNIKNVEIHEIGRTVTEEYCYKDVFPILRPLSDLIKMIEINGERFVPIDWLNDNKSLKLEICVNTQGELVIFNGKTSNIRFLEYCVIEKLFEWHFDVFNLIEEGLAIDINTLKP